VPAFPEALLFSYLDDLDSKMECMRAQLERDEKTEGNFSAYNYAMERVFLKKEQFLRGGEPEGPNAAPPEAVPTAPRPAAALPSTPAPSKRPNDGGAKRPVQSNSLFGDKLLGALGEDR
jgi:hypothetical protein